MGDIMLKKMIGCVLMIIGTAVGAGMLALPLATAGANFQTTMIMMLFSWVVMTVGAFAILEVNLWFPSGSHLISMVDNTLGSGVKRLTWVIYLLLLYSALSAYLSGMGDIIHGLLQSVHISMPHAVTTLIALLALGAIVYRGVGTVDVVNRSLMSVKLFSYVVLVFAVASHISFPHLVEGKYQVHTVALMVIITSFAYAFIVPTLRAYLNSDVPKLKKVIFWGSLAPLIIYIIWTVCIQGLFPRTGDAGLLAIAGAQDPNSLLMQGITKVVNDSFLSDFAKIFMSICMVTSFLGVSIGLTDFIADGLQYAKRGWEGSKVMLMTFLPPFVLVLFRPDIFIKALSYVGFFCVYLLILLPVMMLYQGRYRQSKQGPILVPGGKKLLIIVGIIAVLLLLFQVVAEFFH
jgi:tyrosine-specific transport protein